MGCCASREVDADNDGPYQPAANAQGQAPDSSSRNITASSPQPPGSIASPRVSHASQSRSRGRPNAPLKPIDPAQRSSLPNTLASPAATSSSRHRTHVTPLTDPTALQWTRRRLEKERNDWWDTRTSGQPQIWGAVRLMVEHLQRGEVAEAQALLDATECTCPNGQLWRGVFDASGDWYKMPEWIVIEPEGLVEDEELSAEEDAPGATDGALEEEKNLEVEQLGEQVKVRVRLSTDAKDVVILMRKNEKVSALITKLKQKTGISPFAHVRIVYAGKVYDEHKPLTSHDMWNFDSNHVLVAMIFQ